MKRTGLRFAILSTFYPPYHFGGDANYVRQLAHVLAQRGHEVDVIHDIDAFRLLSKGDDPEQLEEPAGVRSYGLQSRFGPLSCLATQQFGRPVFHGAEIRRILERRQHHVIHFHNVSLVGGPGILAYGDAIKLYTAHEHWLVCPTHVLWRHNREVCDEKQCLRCVLKYRRPPQLWRMGDYLRHMTERVDQFCSPSEFSAAKHAEYGFTRPMELLPSFLPDTHTRQPSGKKHTSGRDRYFFFAGRLEKIKGLQDIIPHFLENPPAQLWIAGSGEFEQQLREQAAGSNAIVFLGHQTQKDLQALYANAVAVVLPSLCYEVFPLVALEALREGTPLIARDLGPYPEIIEKSSAGLLFGNTGEFGAAMNRLLEDEELRTGMEAAAYRAYREHWSEEVAMQAYFGLLRRIASQRDDREAGGILDLCDAAGRLQS